MGIDESLGQKKGALIEREERGDGKEEERHGRSDEQKMGPAAEKGRASPRGGRLYGKRTEHSERETPVKDTEECSRLKGATSLRKVRRTSQKGLKNSALK